MRLLAILCILVFSANVANAYTLSEQCVSVVKQEGERLLAPEVNLLRSELPRGTQLSSKIINVEVKGTIDQLKTLIMADYIITENAEGHKSSYLYKQIFAVAVTLGASNGERCGRNQSTSLICDCHVLQTIDSDEILEQVE